MGRGQYARSHPVARELDTELLCEGYPGARCCARYLGHFTIPNDAQLRRTMLLRFCLWYLWFLVLHRTGVLT